MLRRTFLHNSFIACGLIVVIFIPTYLICSHYTYQEVEKARSVLSQFPETGETLFQWLQRHFLWIIAFALFFLRHISSYRVPLFIQDGELSISRIWWPLPKKVNMQNIAAIRRVFHNPFGIFRVAETLQFILKSGEQYEVSFYSRNAKWCSEYRTFCHDALQDLADRHDKQK